MSVPVAIKTEEVILDNAEYNSTEELDEELQLQLEDSGGESYKIEYQNEVNVTTTTTTTQPQSRQRHQQNSNMNQSGTATAAATATAKSVAGGGGGGATTVGGGTATSNNNKSALENEKRIRREIANSNERRRMQSINAGFQNLRSLLPRNEGEKLSKAAILQQTSQYICELENQKTQLLAQNSQLKRQLGQHEAGNGGIGGGGGGGGGGGDISANGESTAALGGVAIKKRKLTDNVVNIQTISDSSDEGLGSMSPEPMTLLNATTGSGGASVANTKAQMLLAQNAAKELLDMKKQLDKERRLRTMLEEELQTIKRQLYSVATAPQPTAASAVVDANSASATTTTYIPREVIEHTGNLIREDCEEFSYVEIDELTGQQQVVVCSSIEELENEAAAAAAEIITEDNVHEEVILSSTSSTESEQEVAVNAIAKAYAEGSSPTPAMLQPILQAAIKATPKVEVERINETTIMKVKTEKIEQPSGLTRSRQNLETIVEAIRHLEGDHLFTDGADQHKLAVAQQQVGVSGRVQQDAPLALTTKQHAQRKTLAELRPYLQLKGGGAGSKQVTIVGGGGAALTLTTKSALSNAQQGQKDKGSGGGGGGSSSSSGGGGGSTTTAATVTPTAIFKVQTTSNTNAAGGSTNGNVAPAQHVTITTTALKQCRPGVIVAKQLS